MGCELGPSIGMIAVMTIFADHGIFLAAGTADPHNV